MAIIRSMLIHGYSRIRSKKKKCQMEEEGNSNEPTFLPVCVAECGFLGFVVPDDEFVIHTQTLGSQLRYLTSRDSGSIIWHVDIKIDSGATRFDSNHLN